MAKIIEAKAVISAEDKTGAVFDKIAKKIEGIAKSAKSSKQVDALTKSLAKAQEQMAAIDRFGSAKGGFADARTRFREAQMAVEKAARAMKAGEGDAKQLARAYEVAQAAVSRASAAFERQKIAVLQARAGLEGFGIPVSRAVEAQNRLRAAVERTNAVLERQPGMLRRAAGAVGRGAGNAAMLAGPGILHGTYEAAKSGAEMQSEMVKMRAAGIPQADIDRAWAQSGDLTAKYTNVKRADAMERFKELRSIMLNPEEAHTMLPLAVQATAAMNAIDKSGEGAKGLNLAFKGAEMLGLGQDEGRLHSYVDSFIKAKQVMGDTITPEAMYEFAKYAKASGVSLSDRYRMTTALSLAQEMGGQTAGQSTDMFVKQVIGGFQGNQHSAAKEFVSLGLAKKSDFDLTKTGEIKGMKHGRHVAGYQLAQSDPDLWVKKYYIPALKKAGFNTLDEMVGETRRAFPAGRSADLVSKLIQQMPSFENHAKLYNEAQGLDAVKNNKNDPFVALNSLTTSLENFAGVLTQPAMETASGVLNSMADTFASWQSELSKFNKEHPDAAKWIGGGAVAAGVGAGGVATYGLFSGLMNGFGLGASATALDGSAAALSAAAAELSGAAGVKSAASAAAATAGAAGVWGTAAAALPWVAGGAGIAGGLYAMHKSVEDAGYDGLTSGERLRLQRGGSMRDVYRRAFGYGDNFISPELSPTMTYGTGVGGDRSQTVSVSGQVTGEAKMALDINAGSSLIDVVKRAEAAIRLAGSLNSNGPGSLGHSSPDAAAPPPGSPGAPSPPISY